MIELRRKEGENEEQFIWRLGRAKDSGELDMDWTEISEIINKEFREDESEYRNESAYRKPYQQAKRFYENNVFKDLTSEKYIEVIKWEQQQLKKERQKLSDERVDIQKTVREEARKESFIELIERVLERTTKPLEYIPSGVEINSDDDLIVCLSDMHVGIEVKNHWNQYDISILQSRLHKYLDEIKDIQRTHKCKRCELVLGGDAISGIIHPNLRLQNNENVIEQIKIAITYIGDFVLALKDEFEEIRIHSVSGNHSRISPNKEDHLRGEELEAMIPFCLKMQFCNYPNITIYEEGQIDNTIHSFTTRGGKLFYVVHGDKDSVANVVKNLTLMTGRKPDGVLIFHRHYNAFQSQYGVKIIQSGCVSGTDDHCVDLRLSGEPEQAVVVTCEKRTAKCIYDVGLN